MKRYNAFIFIAFGVANIFFESLKNTSYAKNI